MARSGRSVGFWVFLGALVCALLVTGIVFLMNVNGGENLGVSISFALAVFAFFVFPILSGALTAFLARRLEAPLSPWLWAALGVFFPVVAIVVVLVVGASARHKTALMTQASQYAAGTGGAAAGVPPAPALPTSKRCPFCGSPIPFDTPQCPNCAAKQ